MKKSRFVRSIAILFIISIAILSCTKEEAPRVETPRLGTEPGLYDIYIYDVINKTDKRITDSPKIDEWGYLFTPDGKKIIFNQEDNAWTMGLDGSETRKFFTRWDMASWSPDGNKIAFVKDGALYLINQDGSNLLQLTDVIYVWGPVWSKDSKLIAASSNEGLILIDLQGQIRVLSSDPLTGIADWSHSSNKILYTKTDYNSLQSQILVFDMEQEKESVVDFKQGIYSSARFNPITDEILFSLSNGNGARLMLMDSDGKNQRTLTSMAILNGPKWSPDGKNIVLGTENGDIGILDIDNLNLLRINGIQGACLGPIWSPSGNFILYKRGIYYD